jgi:hypothetical protein
LADSEEEPLAWGVAFFNDFVAVLAVRLPAFFVRWLGFHPGSEVVAPPLAAFNSGAAEVELGTAAVDLAAAAEAGTVPFAPTTAAPTASGVTGGGFMPSAS